MTFSTRANAAVVVAALVLALSAAPSYAVEITQDMLELGLECTSIEKVTAVTSNSVSAGLSLFAHACMGAPEHFLYFLKKLGEK